MPCIAPSVEDDQTDAGATPHPQRPTCHARRYERWEDDHHQADLDEGKEYFFIVLTPSAPSSIVKVSDALTTATRPPTPTPPPLEIDLPDAPSSPCGESVVSPGPRQQALRSPSPPIAINDGGADSVVFQGAGEANGDKEAPAH